MLLLHNAKYIMIKKNVKICNSLISTGENGNATYLYIIHTNFDFPHLSLMLFTLCFWEWTQFYLSGKQQQQKIELLIQENVHEKKEIQKQSF